MVLSKFIVSAYQMLLEIGLWGWMIASVILGVKMSDNLGGVISGAVIGLAVGAISAVLMFGAFLILGDIRTSLRKIENGQDSN